jgi:hypothetical protein
MAVRLRIYADYDWVPDGTAGSAVAAAMANNPALGTVGNAQTLRQQVMQPVIAINPNLPTQGELQTATTDAAAQLSALLTTAVVAEINGWATGQP